MATNRAHMHIRIHSHTHRQTDGQTDRQTDRQTYIHITIYTYILFTSPQQDFLNAIFEVTLQYIKKQIPTSPYWLP